MFDANRYEKGVGSIFSCQIAIQSYIEDTQNNPTQRIYAETIYEWLGVLECTIDELCEKSYEYSVFILDALKKYEPNFQNSNLLLNYDNAIQSLKYQISLTQN